MRRPGLALTAAVAWIAVVIGHLVSYFLTYPSQGIRHIHLALTGHSWLGLATASLVAAVPVLLLLAVVKSVRSSTPWTGGSLAFHLATIQVPAFLAIELLERQGSIGRALSDPAVFLGLALQPLIAVLAAWLLDLLRRAVHAIATWLAPRRFELPRPTPRTAPARSVPRPWLLVPSRRRAPPPFLFA